MEPSSRTTLQLSHRFPVGLLFLLLLCSHAYSQWGFGGYVGPGIQSIAAKEPTITDPYQPRLLPQFGVCATHHFRRKFHLMSRVGVAYDLAGMQYRSYPHLDHSYDRYVVQGRIDYLKAFLGIGYGQAISERLELNGFADFAFGVPVFVKFRDVENGRVVSESTSSGQFYANYAGVNLSLSLKYFMNTYACLGFSPTVQSQINGVLGQGGPVFHFVGFVPRIEFTYFLPSKFKQVLGRPGTKTLYINEI